MAYAFVSQLGNTGSGAITTLAVGPFTPGAGNHLTVIYAVTGAVSDGTVTDGVNTYTSQGTTGLLNAAFWAMVDANNVPGSAITITLTATGGGFCRYLYVREDSGLANGAYEASTFTAAAITNPGVTTDAIATASITVGAVPCALIGIGVNTGSSTGANAGTGFSAQSVVTSGAHSFTTEDKRLTSGASIPVTMTQASAGSFNWMIFGAAFAEPSSGVPVAWLT